LSKVNRKQPISLTCDHANVTQSFQTAPSLNHTMQFRCNRAFISTAKQVNCVAQFKVKHNFARSAAQRYRRDVFSPWCKGSIAQAPLPVTTPTYMRFPMSHFHQRSAYTSRSLDSHLLPAATQQQRI